MINKTIIIAEAGVNHDGNLENAFKLVDAAVNAGVDFVKFQTFKTEKLVSLNAKKADYQIKNTKSNIESQYQMLKRLELSDADHSKLLDYCNSKGINFFSTAFDLESLQYLSSIGLKLVKIPSGEITNLPYLRLAAKLFQHVIISTGMATLDEIRHALSIFIESGIPISNITILHCNTEYPTPMEDVNLKAMQNIGNTFNVSVGYSDHTRGIEVAISAVALGAKIIEKHFTLDKTLEGPDHAASLDPEELKAMVKAIRNIELALSGNGIKYPSKSELKNIIVARKSIHASKKLNQGDILKENDFVMLRPGDGISPMFMDDLIGKKLLVNISKGHKINFNEIEF